MRRVYAVMISLAMLMAAAPGLATADNYAGPAVRQQAIKDVIARALSQRGVPFTYGGGSASGPSASTVPAPRDGVDSGLTFDRGGAQLANVPTPTLTTSSPAAPSLTTPSLTTPSLTTPGSDPLAAAPASNVVGFDASGLIQYAFAGVGIKVPRSSGEQYKVGRKVTPAEALPGDLMFYGPEGNQSVALFVGNGQMVEATDPVVKVSPVRTNNMTPYLTRIIEW